jgi:hypothetical protein
MCAYGQASQPQEATGPMQIMHSWNFIRMRGCCCVREENTALKLLLRPVGYAAYIRSFQKSSRTKVIPRYFRFPCLRNRMAE